MTEPITLHIVRHGETTWNAGFRIQGQTHEVPLSEKGRRQASEVAETLASMQAQLIIASDLMRAVQTAEIIAERLALGVLLEPSLRERHWGVMQGQTGDEAVAGLGISRAEYFRDPDLRAEGGESNREVMARVHEWVEKLRASSPSREIVVVTHGGTMNVLLAHLRGEPVESMAWERLENCAVRTVVVSR